MTFSKLISSIRRSPNNSGNRIYKLNRFTPHCFVGWVDTKRIGDEFEQASRQASCNYGIGKQGDIIGIVPEEYRSWCSDSKDNDNRAITVECASNNVYPYDMTMQTYNSLVKLAVDICKRNGKKRMTWIPDKTKALKYQPADDEMLITVHRWFAAKSCPGDWLYNRLGSFAEQVTTELTPNYYRVQLGAFKYDFYAKAYLATVKKKGFSDAFIAYGADGIKRIQVGAYEIYNNAYQMLSKVKAAGFKDAYITTSK